MKKDASVGIVLTSRDARVFQTLGITRVLDAEQVRTIAGFTSIRRTNRRLLKLLRAGLLRRWFCGTKSGGQRALYGLSPEGARHVGEKFHKLFPWKQDTLITSSQFLSHQQAVNAVFLMVRFQPLPAGMSCERWVSFNLPLSASVPLIPDGYFEIRHDRALHPIFVEMDLGTESAAVWKRKADLYLKLALGGEFERLFHEKLFRVLVILPSERRLDSVRRTVARQTEKVFWFSTRENVDREGLWQRTWLRPIGEEKVSVL